MASGLTNLGKQRLLEMALRDTQDSASMDTAPLNLALSDSTVTLSATTTIFDTVSQIATGNGYTDGGDPITRSEVLTVWDTSSDTAGSFGRIRLVDHVWTASGGTLPSSGNGAHFALLIDDNATIGSRQVYAYWDLSQARSVGNGSSLTLQDIEIRLT